MGTNRRYAASIDARMDKKIAESALKPKPQSLSPEEAGLDDEPARRAPEPIEVEAWVRVSPGVVKVLGQAVEWNSRAVRVEWKNPDGSWSSAWVYGGAVTRR